MLAVLSEFLLSQNILMYLFAYLVGSIPFGLVFARLIAGVNIKKQGSGSIGATNVLRVVKAQNPKLGKLLSAFTFAFDFLKGIFVMFVAQILGFDSASMIWSLAVFAVLGHCFSVYLMFEGGKGIATGVGVVMYLLPLEALLGLAAWFVVGKIFKISSLASLAGLFVAIGLSFVIHPDIKGIDTHAPLLIIGFVILYKHTPNIIRLISGKEKAVI